MRKILLIGLIMCLILINGCSIITTPNSYKEDVFSIDSCEDWAKSMVPSKFYASYDESGDQYVLNVMRPGYVIGTTWNDGTNMTAPGYYLGIYCGRGNTEGQNVNYFYCPQSVDLLRYTSEQKIDEEGVILGYNKFSIEELIFKETDDPDYLELVSYEVDKPKHSQDMGYFCKKVN
ncbi:MAG: hypothetical protein ABH849_00635 [Nanoarchaeota archaeon]